MSAISPGQTRKRGEAIAAALEAHPPFAAWKAAGIFRAQWNPSRNMKMGLEEKLAKLMDQKVGKIEGVLVTITPSNGSNTSADKVKVSNETVFALQLWERLTTRPEDSPLPDPLDILDELQRVLSDIGFDYAVPAGLSAKTKPKSEKVQVLGWEESADPHYLLYQITFSCRVPLGPRGE